MSESACCGLSVVMPTRNQASFIRSAVNTVLAQAEGLPGTMELVVADGASTDGTPEILAALAAEHPGLVHWVSEPDQGPADAVNRAVARARGAIVGWLNSDDLYTPGAAARAVAALQAHPEWVMVYGEGEHVDLHGAPLGRYPTRGPETPLAAWADGCHICQPTAFFRRKVFVDLGGLDTSLRAAFDYEFWLRLLKACPGRVGFVPAVQALSRLHEAGITLRMRQSVALEAIEVIHRHIGPAPLHWLLTHAGELLAQHPSESQARDLHAHLLALLARASPHLEPGAEQAFHDYLRTHRGLHTASECFGCNVYGDGWMPAEGELRLLQPPAPAQPVRRIRLHCRHGSPVNGPLRLQVIAPQGEIFALDVPHRGRFVLDIPVAADRPQARLVFRVSASGAFVPAEVEPGSTDRRHLTFLLDDVELL